MLYHFFEYLEHHTGFPGAGIFRYLSFRTGMAVILALLLGIIFGSRVIKYLRRKQIGETVRDLGLEGQLQKKGTPTMGGLIILGAILIPILLLGDLTNVYVILLILSTVWLGAIGFLDDYIKVFCRNKEGLQGRFKIVGQVGLGIIVGSVMCFNSTVIVKERVEAHTADAQAEVFMDNGTLKTVYLSDTDRSITTIPFFKNNEFDYRWLAPGGGGAKDICSWVIYILAAIFIVTAVSNGANLTDGLDGLVTGVTAPIVVVLGIFAYLSGNIIYADYLNIMYIPRSGEMLVFAGAFTGALFGFLWYNSYPAQVFMGDTGSLTIGGLVAVFALLVRKELLLPILCGIFLVEALSVMIQVGYFKYTRRKYGEGRRVFLMSPLHHHYQMKGFFESKIVIRIWILQILLAAITLVTLKIR